MKGPRPLLGLTLQRPWTVLIARGLKRIENRRWSPEPTLQPGEWFAVHAGVKIDLDCQPFALKVLGNVDVFFGGPSANTAGAIVAVAKYGGIVRASSDPWFTGPYGWLLDQVVEIAPVKCKGAQGLWRVDSVIADRVRQAYRVALQVQEREGARP